MSHPIQVKQRIKLQFKLMFKKYGSTPEEYDTQVVSREDKKRAKKIIEIII